MSSPRIPSATYRLQLNADFTFEDARRLVPYLHRLGISDVYASPILAAQAGSTHGYDVVDPTRLNPELGTDDDFDRLAREIASHGMGLIIDIVPNHMAASYENPWWRDVLENGPASPYADCFDIDWDPPQGYLKGRLLLPVLGKTLRDSLSQGEIELGLEPEGFVIRYHENRFPAAVTSYESILAQLPGSLEEGIEGPAEPSARLCPGTELDYRAAQDYKARFLDLVRSSQGLRESIEQGCNHFNSQARETGNVAALERILSQQYYVLEFWQTAMREINYRRFFDISHLVGVRVENPRVFDDTHARTLGLVWERKVTGLRIDHIDGLWDPSAYLKRLQAAADSNGVNKQQFYVVVEKILCGDETLPEDWPVFGTTGYDFLNAVNRVFVDPDGLQSLRSFHSRFCGDRRTFEDVYHDTQRQVLQDLFSGELAALADECRLLARKLRAPVTIMLEDLKEAITAVTASLPVYRTYSVESTVGLQDRRHLEHAFTQAKIREPRPDPDALAFLRHLLLLDFPPETDAQTRLSWTHFVRRWQQFTGPAMAKGFEDTALYNYVPLLSLNEVGGEPGRTDFSPESFHRHNRAMRVRWPHTLLATATHDTKRGEDARARINVLSELPERWEQCVMRWSEYNRGKKIEVRGRHVPGPKTEMLLYQTLVGSCPLSDEGEAQFKERVQAYLVKAAREAKSDTSWLSPDPEYEAALVKFVDSILDVSGGNGFLREFEGFQREIAFYGMLNSVGQVLLKITSPGVPDFFQGSELWDLSMVDPDNRRPVDFETRARFLAEIGQRRSQEMGPPAQELLDDWTDGRLKLFVTHQALGLRSSHPDLFRDGEYMPLKCSGHRSEHICSFMRRFQGTCAVVVVPTLVSRLVQAGQFPIGENVWEDARLAIPRNVPGQWVQVLTGEHIASEPEGLRVSDVLRKFPVALLLAAGTDSRV